MQILVYYLILMRQFIVIGIIDANNINIRNNTFTGIRGISMPISYHSPWLTAGRWLSGEVINTIDPNQQTC